jgi:hypothetical protein
MDQRQVGGHLELHARRAVRERFLLAITARATQVLRVPRAELLDGLGRAGSQITNAE